MKLAATYAIAALAKRPPTKRRVPSIGDLNLLPMGALSASHANGSAIALDANAPSSSGADGSTAGSSEAQGEGSVHGSVNSSVSSGAAHHNGRAAASLRHPSPSRLRRRSAHSCEVSWGGSLVGCVLANQWGLRRVFCVYRAVGPAERRAATRYWGRAASMAV